MNRVTVVQLEQKIEANLTFWAPNVKPRSIDCEGEGSHTADLIASLSGAK